MAKIVHIQLKVTNLDKAMKFYSEVFGWEFRTLDQFPTTAMWYDSKYTTEPTGSLVEVEEMTTPSGNGILFIHSENLEKSSEMIGRCGGTVDSSVSALGSNFGEVMEVRDPFDNQLVLWRNTNDSEGK